MSTKQAILEEIKKAEEHIPRTSVPDLPGQGDFPDVPEWHSFEHSIWRTGEEVRGLLQKNSKLRSDPEIQQAILKVCKNGIAKRGRQSFALLLGSPKCAHLAEELIESVNDNDVCGHIISTLLKMNESRWLFSTG